MSFKPGRFKGVSYTSKMKFYQGKKQLMVIYAALAVYLGAILVIGRYFAMSPASLILTFFGLLSIPGFSLARLFKIKLGEYLDEFILWITLGLIFALLGCALAIILGWTISILMLVYLVSIIGLFIISLIIDLFKLAEPEITFKCSWKKLLDINNLSFLIVIALAMIVVAGIGIQGTLFRGGDANFHLSILRKAYEGARLTPANLSFIKSDTLHVAYGFPVWHVFLSLLAKFSKVDIYLLWKTISIPLSILAILIWYWLAKQFFSSRFMAIISLAIFLNYIFLWKTGYLFTMTSQPDTLNNILFLPLAVGLFLKYVFGKTTKARGDLKILSVLVIFGILMGLIHITQYLYLMIMVALMGFIWLLSQWRLPNFKIVLTRLGLFLGANLIIFLPVLIFLEFKSHHLLSRTFAALWRSHNIRKLRYVSFAELNLHGKLSIMVLPLAIVFIKKQRALIFLVAIYLLLFLTFYNPISHLMVRIGGYIFVNRIFGSIVWHFLVLGLILGFLILLVDRLVERLSLTKTWRIIINLIFVFAVVAFYWVQVKFQTAASIFNWLFSESTDNWLNHNYLWVITGVTIVVIAIIIGQSRWPKTADFFQFTEPKNNLVSVSFVLAILLILFSTTYSYLWEYTNLTIRSLYLFKSASHLDLRTGENHLKNVTASMGGQAMVDFVRTSVPAKSVFFAPGSTVTLTFPTLLDQYMVDYAGKKLFNQTSQIYKDKVPLEEKLQLINKGKIEYILLNHPSQQGESFFDQYPQYFQKIFKNESIIYKVLPQAIQDGQKYSNQ